MNNKSQPVISLVQFSEPKNLVTARYLSGLLLSKGYKTNIISVKSLKQSGRSGLSWDYEEYYLPDCTIYNLMKITKDSLFIGFTIFTFDAHIMKTIYASFEDQRRPPIVVGGPHPTLDPYDASLFSDFVCIGDGEKGLVELADKLINRSVSLKQTEFKQVSENILSSAWLRNNLKGDLPISIEASLDSQSFPDYSIEAEFLLEEDKIIKLNKENANQYVDTYCTFLSRGCIYNCAFCAHKAIAKISGFKKRVKCKEARHFIDELTNIKNRLPWVGAVAFYDPNILSNRKSDLNEILSQYKHLVGLPLTVTGFTFNNVDENILRWFLDAGMNYVIFGLQSGSEKTKDLLNRKDRNFKIWEIDLLLQQLKKKYEFNVQYDIILDIPWENQDDVFESVNFIAKLGGYDVLDIFSLRFFPGTDLFKKALADGLIDSKNLQEEYKRVYRGLDYKYENFIFLLIRDIPFFRKILAKKLTSANIVPLMNNLFNRHGKRIFNFYSSLLYKFFGLIRKVRSLQKHIAAHGLSATLRHLMVRLGLK